MIMSSFQVQDKQTLKIYWCIAPGPAVAINLVARQWNLPIGDLKVFDRRGIYLGEWAA